MLFNSFAFFLIFLPITLAGYFYLSKTSIRASIIFLVVASLLFYAYWNIGHLPLLLGSIIVNYHFGTFINKKNGLKEINIAKYTLIIGIVFNMSVLIYFKYLDFIINNLEIIIDVPLVPRSIRLPIGISFFTFTQIAYLVDCHAGKVREYKKENYGLFVTYFPHLIVGPILHHKDMIPQFARPDAHTFIQGRLILGLFIFTIGLFKKVIIADGVSQFVAPVFDVYFANLSPLEAWIGALAYTYQLYFDFSAYCDMAYGLSYMFGIILPINFNSPYKAKSIIEFWRRWHITLSTFLKEYLYVPLGGNKKGQARRYTNLMITMILGGLWHGANWTFIIWGLLHGLYLVINHISRRLIDVQENYATTIFCTCITFLSVVLAWTFFRASSASVAINLLTAMFSGKWDLAMGTIGGVNRIMDLNAGMLWIFACSLIVFLFPNVYDIIGKGIRYNFEKHLTSFRGSFLFGSLFIFSIMLLTISKSRGVSEFLYFTF